MIDTIFYFCPTQTEYEQSLAGEGISSKTITFVEDVREIYFNGRGYGKTSTQGLMSEDAFNTWKQTIQNRIAAIVEDAEEQKTLSEQALQDAMDSVNTDLTQLRSDLETDITDSINDAITNADGNTVWTELSQTNNGIETITTRLNKFSNADGLIYNSALQSLVDTGVSNNTAFTSLSSKWAVQGENQTILQWLASGFDSQTVTDNTSFARMYADYKDNTDAAIDDVEESTALAQATADANSAKLEAIADWSGYVEGQPVSYKGGVVTEANKSGVVSSLIAEDSAVRAAITAYVNSAGSNITLTADHINLDGTTIAQRLIAASAALGGFVIEQNALVGTTTESGDITRSVTLMPVGLQFDRTDTKGTSVSSDDTVLQKLEINPVDGIKFTQNNSNVSSWLKMDGSGSLANGNLAWSSNGGLRVNADGLVINAEHEWPWWNNTLYKGLGAVCVVGDYTNLYSKAYWDADNSEYVYNVAQDGVDLSLDSSEATVSMASALTAGIFDGSGMGLVLLDPLDVDTYGLDQVKEEDGVAPTGRSLVDIGISQIHPIARLHAAVFPEEAREIATRGLVIESPVCVYGGGVFSNGPIRAFGTVTARNFIKPGGTSSQFLKADGSVDSNVYLTSSALSDYLPLSAGSSNPLTGDLYINPNAGTSDVGLFVGNGLEVLSHYLTARRYAQAILSSNQIILNSVYGVGVYSDYDNNTYGDIIASSFVVNGGTSSQFLKADGSVDSTSYLPTSGGTMTGDIDIEGTSEIRFDADNAIRAEISALSAYESRITVQGYDGVCLEVNNPNITGTMPMFDIADRGFTSNRSIYFPEETGVVFDIDSYIKTFDDDNYLHINGYDTIVASVNGTPIANVTSSGIILEDGILRIKGRGEGSATFYTDVNGINISCTNLVSSKRLYVDGGLRVTGAAEIDNNLSILGGNVISVDNMDGQTTTTISASGVNTRSNVAFDYYNSTDDETTPKGYITAAGTGLQIVLTNPINDYVSINGDIVAGSIKKSGGASNEVLMADGSTMTLADLKTALNNI